MDWIDRCTDVAKTYMPIKFNDVEVIIQDFNGGRLDAYITKEFVIKPFKIPTLFIDGKLFMSITPMELQSHENPIKWSHGHVLIAGLGLGYIVNQVAKKRSVETVTVVEKDARVIAAYKKLFPKRSKKILLIKQDIFKFESDREYDYFYADIWPSFDADTVPEDMAQISFSVKAKTQSFWGIEKYILEGFEDTGECPLLPFAFPQNMRKDCQALLLSLVNESDKARHDWLDTFEVEV